VTEKLLRDITDYLKVPEESSQQFCSDLLCFIEETEIDGEIRHSQNSKRKLFTKFDALRKVAENLVRAAADPTLTDWDPDLLRKAKEIKGYIDRFHFRVPPKRPAKRPRGSTRPDFHNLACWVFEAARRCGVKLTITSDVDGEASGSLATALRKLNPLLPVNFLPDSLKASTLRRAVRSECRYPPDRPPAAMPPDPPSPDPMT